MEHQVNIFHQGVHRTLNITSSLILNMGYCETAGNRIHLYGDSTRWTIVFEKSGYQNRGPSAEIELDYIGFT